MKLDLGRLRKKGVYALIAEVCAEPFLVQNVEGRILYGDSDSDYTTKYPLLFQDEQFGWISGGKRAYAISRLVMLFAASECEKKELGQETLAKYRELIFLYDITEKLAASLRPQEVAILVISEVNKLIKADKVSLMLINEENGLLEVIARLGEEAKTKLTLKLGEGIAGNIALSGKAEIINDTRRDPRFLEGRHKVSSMMCAPLRIKDRVIGVINLSSAEPANYTAEDLKLLSVLTLQAAAAIENARLYDNLKEAFLTTVSTLAETIDKRDPYTGGHTKRVMEYSLAIGNFLGLSNPERERLKLAAILHDIGKIGVRDNILLKEGKLDETEYNEMKRHTVYGEEVLKYIKFFNDIIPGVKSHHERYDGRGYPEGLSGEQTDIIARIIAVADTFDAMTSDRPYRKALSKEAAFAEIKKNSGSQYDPQVVEAFLKAVAMW
ncbi:HD domain-containing protein [Desulfosporosinus sp. PR]|uniref:HD-GYP domain-containing protein n=1 Tax=Candidatus Desulfosporosinus nitrosoreducens TaxID=3401928 RepID=UPI0027F0BEF3|nr:HD domain-containing phosphohydrolase [Desulfosporosinus sp. PR]MDQ7096735.1 HD domain-containing protein [Desulfosporosinus sp. PR]